MTRQSYPPEVKAQALAALASGAPATEVASTYAVAVATVRSWKARELTGLAPTATPDRRAALGEQVMNFLQDELNALRKQAQLFQDADWLKTQCAADLALLHGVCTDKAVLLLQAIEDPANTSPTAADARVS
jgi:transposase-like protein